MLVFVTLAFASLTSAWCGTQEPGAFMKEQHLKHLAKEANSSSGSEGYRMAASSFTIQTYVSVIASGNSEAEGNIPQSKIQSQVDVLNSNYAPTGFQFNLSATSRILNPAWTNLQALGDKEYEMKSTLRQGGYMDLNIYLTTIQPIGGNGILGYATFPQSPVTQELLNKDGLVISSETIPGGDEFPYNQGITAVHEIGHWLGLFHPFQAAIGSSDGCKGPGDYIFDTPAEKSAAFGCQVGRDTCLENSTTSIQGPDPVHNYMDYSNDACLTQFTKGQMMRMQGIYESLRLMSNTSIHEPGADLMAQVSGG